MASVSAYERNLSPQISTTKVHLSLNQLTLKTAALLTILAGLRIHTVHMLSVIHIDQPHDKVIFRIIRLRKCFKQSRRNQPVVYRAYVEDQLLCPVKCIYVYLVQRTEIIAHKFTEFFITFGKPHYPAFKNLLALWVEEVMGNSGIDTEIFKPHSPKVASNSGKFVFLCIPKS